MKLCVTVKKQILGTCLFLHGWHGIDCHTHVHGSTLERNESSPTTLGCCKDTTQLKLFQKAGVVLFRQRPRVCLFLYLCFYLCFCQHFCRLNCHTLPTGIPAVFRSMPRFATVLASVDVCKARVGRAISSLVLFFTFALSFTFLERESHLHSFHFQMTRSDSLQSFDRRNTTATGLHEELFVELQLRFVVFVVQP